MARYAVVFETRPNEVSGYVPDLPGCVATGPTVDSVRELLQGAIRLHLDGIREDGQAVPAPSTVVDYIEPSAPTDTL